ncbi:MAG: hypothetical protein QOJ94_772 [Sphingomonadales bacterium]|jgi:hypothetical protein|nr:hypothetical protein [Sphingomonadales bacterium]
MRRLVLAALLLVTAACGKKEEAAAPMALRTFEVNEPPPAPGLPEDAARQPRVDEAAPAAGPRIAYTYSLGYRLGAGRVAEVQRSHVSLCDRLGPARCRILSMSRDSGDDSATEAALSLLVDARIARPFQDRLDAAASGAGGTVSNRGIQAEDLSKQMIDTEAKLRGKEALSQRLLALLQTHRGNVGELVQAERAYAQTQEELEAARAWLAEMRGRVTMSKIDIAYAGVAPVSHSAWRPVRDSLAAAGDVVGASLARLVTLLLGAAPWLLFLLVAWRLARRLGFRGVRLPWRRAVAKA